MSTTITLEERSPVARQVIGCYVLRAQGRLAQIPEKALGDIQVMRDNGPGVAAVDKTLFESREQWPSLR